MVKWKRNSPFWSSQQPLPWSLLSIKWFIGELNFPFRRAADNTVRKQEGMYHSGGVNAKGGVSESIGVHTRMHNIHVTSLLPCGQINASRSVSLGPTFPTYGQHRRRSRSQQGNVKASSIAVLLSCIRKVRWQKTKQSQKIFPKLKAGTGSPRAEPFLGYTG